MIEDRIKVYLALFCCVAIGFLAAYYIWQPRIYTLSQPIFIYIAEPTIKETYITIESPPAKQPTYIANKFAREFESVEQFKTWYWQQHFLPILSVGDSLPTCVDYAQAVQIRACEQGYLVSLALVRFNEIYGVKVLDDWRGHMGNLVVIDGIIYYVEPNPEEFNIIRIVPLRKE